jgi:N-acetyltransferase
MAKRLLMLAIKPTTLATDKLVLRPLALDDVPALAKAAADGSLWDKRTTTVPRPDGFIAYVKHALALQEQGLALPFATVLRDGERVIGSTRFMNIDAANHRVEIGTTWISGSWQRTFVNTHAKFLMLKHAFEELGCNAIELRTHSQNSQSRAAIERLGANFDGVLRRHMIMPDGHIRDTAVYSIVKEEWPGVRDRLESKLDR